MKINKGWLALLGVLVFSAGSTRGEIFKRSYVDGVYRNVKLSDNALGDDQVDLFGAALRLGGKENMDFIAEVAKGKIEENDLLTATAGVQPYWEPEDGFYKVFGNALVKYDRIENKDLEVKESDFGFAVGVGSELSAGESLSFIGQLNYLNIHSSDDIEVSGSIHYWVTDWLLTGLGVDYAVDGEVTTIQARVGIGF